MTLRLQLWNDDDLATLRRSNAPEMMTYLGGPETEEALLARHAKYLRMTADGTLRMFRIVVDDHPEGIGTVGYWPTTHDGRDVYEAGWSVETAHQGHGHATAALVALVANAREHASLDELHAYPRVENAPSNAICRKAGFTLVRERMPFEYPPGNPIVCNDWAVRLR